LDISRGRRAVHVRGLPDTPGVAVVWASGTRTPAEELLFAVRTLDATWDWVIVEGPPLSESSGDALAVASAADALVLLADTRSLTRPSLEAAEESLNWVEAPVVGVISTTGGARRRGAPDDVPTIVVPALVQEEKPDDKGDPPPTTSAEPPLPVNREVLPYGPGASAGGSTDARDGAEEVRPAWLDDPSRD
jgi:hypothetical protein